ncbi:MAG: Smr/MutS family protein [Gemmatimonadota bacterium]|nr:Smr/MutS family protein [Gemmatimonadota bacterium]
MTERADVELPHGVLVSSDAGAPSAFPPEESSILGSEDALQALEFAAVLDQVAALAAGPLGAESIRRRRPVTDVPWIQAELGRVEELAALVRRGSGVTAESVPTLARVLSLLRLNGSVLDGAELLAIRRTITAARLVVAELRRVAADAPSVAWLERPLPDKVVERRLEQSIDDEGELLDGASADLAAARSDIRTARDRLIQRLESLLRGIGGEGGVTLREGRYVIPVPRDLRSRPDGIIHGESASGATLYLEPAAVIPLGNAFREAESRARREELRVMRELTERLRPEAGAIREVHAMCITVDDLAARARWAAAVDGHRPTVATAPADLKIVNGRHPLLLGDTPAASPAAPPSRRTVVPFDLTLTDPERTILLSGPNTGGKSVLLKAVGLHLLLAQSGIIPPVGPGSVFPVVTRVFADIGDRQSIAANLSTFSAHLTLLRVILDEADDGSLVLLDEIGSGTDPAEGAALAGATLHALTRRRALTLATTHLGALKRLATVSPGIVNASLQFDAATLQPTYHLIKGVPGRSYGIAIARRLGLREDVVGEAEAAVPDAERSLDALLAVVEERGRDQMQREILLAERIAESEGHAAALAAQAEAQTIREATLKRREKDAERQGREQARQYLLEAREKVEAAIAQAAAAGDGARDARRLVEQAAQAEAAALRELDRPGARTADAPAAFAAGDRVRLESGTAGEVLELRPDGRVIVRIGSLKLIADPATLVKLAGQAPRKSAEPVRSAEAGDASFEVDLRGMTGDEAAHVVTAAIDAAILSEQPYLRVIHGKGTGVVRERVQAIARSDRRITAHGFAPPNQGGTGVTLVEFGA